MLVVALGAVFRALDVTWLGVVLFAGVGVGVPFALMSTLALLRRARRTWPYLLGALPLVYLAANVVLAFALRNSD